MVQAKAGRGGEGSRKEQKMCGGAGYDPRDPANADLEESRAALMEAARRGDRLAPALTDLASLMDEKRAHSLPAQKLHCHCEQSEAIRPERSLRGRSPWQSPRVCFTTARNFGFVGKNCLLAMTGERFCLHAYCPAVWNSHKEVHREVQGFLPGIYWTIRPSPRR